MSRPHTVRRRVGALLLDAPRLVWALRPGWLAGARDAWLGARNRHETLEPAPTGSGVACRWRWTSELTAVQEWPGLGRLLMRRALAAHPVVLAPDRTPCERPTLSVVVGHRGGERAGLLLATLASLAGQTESALECVVVEQSTRSCLAGRLPGWVRHVHTPPPDEAMPYSRAWAFNVGARVARGEVLVFHDGDLLVPADFASGILGRVAEGFEVVDAKRFLFYLGERDTVRVVESGTLDAGVTPVAVLQNSPGGGSLAVARATFEAVGGYDEGFVGWGGEDNELWERLESRRCSRWGHLPLVHLWHAPQPERRDSAEPAMVLRYHELSDQPPGQRIEALRERAWGTPAGPHPPWTPAGD